jgi:hypothetical protein
VARAVAAALILLALAVPAAADHGSGCPVLVRPGMKVHEGQHDGQWFTASYPMAICGPSETATTWTVEPAASVVTDTCLQAADYVVTEAMGEKTCDRKRGKIFWIGTPGTYTLTAHAPDGAGSWTLTDVVVD